MLKSKSVYMLSKGIQLPNNKSEKTILHEMYLEKLYADINEQIFITAIDKRKTKLTYQVKEPMEVSYKTSISNYYHTKYDFKISYKLDMTKKYIMYIVIDWGLKEYIDLFRDDKILNQMTREEAYNIISNNYFKITPNQFNKIMDEINKKPNWNRYSSDLDMTFEEIDKYYQYYKKTNILDPEDLSDSIKRLIAINGIQLNDAPILNKYQYFYNKLRDLDIIKTNSFYNIAVKEVTGTVLQNIFSCYSTKIYDEKKKEMIYLFDAKISDKECDKYIDMLKYNIYRSDSICRIVNYIRQYYGTTIKAKQKLYEIKENHSITNECKEKYKGLREDLINHVYFAKSGPNKLLTLERSPEVSKKSLYDRLRIQFSILGVDDKKDYFEYFREEILSYMIEKASENKYFKSVPINCFAVTRIDMNISGDVVVIMELKEPLLNMNLEDKNN